MSMSLSPEPLASPQPFELARAPVVCACGHHHAGHVPGTPAWDGAGMVLCYLTPWAIGPLRVPAGGLPPEVRAGDPVVVTTAEREGERWTVIRIERSGRGATDGQGRAFGDVRGWL